MIQEQINEYIKEFEKIPNIPKNVFKNTNIEDSIFSIVTSSKFRRTALDEVSKSDLLNKIKQAVANNLPIELSIPFGSYKSFKLKKYENVYWSEIFNIYYMIQYLLPITFFYTPGVVLSYSYQKEVMHEINNISSSDIIEYQKIFNELLDYYNKILPLNFRLRMQAINDLYSSEQEWKKELEELYIFNKNNWFNVYDENTKNKKLTSARNNFAVKGEKDYSNLSESELEEKIINSAIMVDSIEGLSKRRPFNKSTNRIQLVFLKGPKPAIHTGVCEGSTNQFWVGLGALEIRDNRIIPKIFPFSQILNFNKISVNTIFSKISDKFDNIFYYIKK